jgi:Ca2+/H+ antiporter
MAVLGLVLPSFTVSSPGPTLSPLQSTFLILMSVGLYGVFLGIQTRRHRDYFVSMSAATVTASGPGVEKHGGLALRSVKYHGLLVAGVCPSHCSPGQTNRGTNRLRHQRLGRTCCSCRFTCGGIDPIARIPERRPRDLG